MTKDGWATWRHFEEPEDDRQSDAHGSVKAAQQQTDQRGVKEIERCGHDGSQSGSRRGSAPALLSEGADG